MFGNHALSIVDATIRKLLSNRFVKCSKEAGVFQGGEYIESVRISFMLLDRADDLLLGESGSALWRRGQRT